MRYALLFLVGCMGFWWWSNQERHTSKEARREVVLELSRLEKESKHLATNTLPSFESMHSKLLDVFVEKDGKTVFWDTYRYIPKDIDILIGKIEVIPLKNWHEGPYEVKAYLDISPEGKAGAYFYDEYGGIAVRNGIRKSTSDLSLTIKKDSKKQGKTSSTITNVFFILFLFFAILHFYDLVAVQKTFSLPAFAIGGALLWVFLWFLLDRLFPESLLMTIRGRDNISPSLGHLLLHSVFLFFGARMAYDHITSKEKSIKIKTFVAPAFISILFIYVSHFIFDIMKGGSLPVADERVLQFSVEGFAFLSVLIIAMGVIFLLSVVSMPPKTIYSGWRKYALWFAMIVITYPLSLILEIGFPIWILYLFVFAYLLVMDVYVMYRHPGLVFTFWWIVMFSGFLAVVIFHQMVKIGIKNQASNLTYLYQKPNARDIGKTTTLDSIIRAGDIFYQLSTLPFPSGLDKADFTAYVRSILTQKNPSVSLPYMDFSVDDSEGNTLFHNYYNTSSSFLTSVNHSEKIDDYIFFSPFDGAYYLDYFVENQNFENSPFRVIFKIDYHHPHNIHSTKAKNYVIFKNGVLIDSYIDSPGSISLQKLKNVNQSFVESDISYAYFSPREDVKIVSFYRLGGLIKPLSLFSFLVSLTGMFFFLLSIFNRHIKLFEGGRLWNPDSSSLRVKIQSTIILLIVVSFVIIGLVTVYYFKNVFESNRFLSQNKEVTTLLKDIHSRIEGASDQAAGNLLANNILQLASIHNQKMSLFDIQGNYLRSSFETPQIKKIPYDILQKISQTDKTIAERYPLYGQDHMMDFIPLFYKSNKPFGILGLLYRPVNKANESIKAFLSTILNVYVFLFFIAIALAIAIGNSITRPLSILSEKLKKYKLGRANQPLEWNSNDEIGQLIHDYNRLIHKLDESAQLLAKTERDGAWREMAKQVAHEIKNPLTPMKLSIQYLQHSIAENPDSAKDLIKKVTSTMINQINNLNQIADTFSNFAKMPKASNEKISINEVVDTVHDLFRKRDDMDIHMSEPIDDLYVFADKNHLVRVLNNVVKNAIQAIPDDRRGLIEISLEKVDDKAVIKVSDNGKGIPDHMKDKVFTPNFTTKSSGTGLGLAISANLLDSFNGQIWFESQEGKGTVFFIEVPLMKEGYEETNLT